jgi:hypothetical protein
VRGGTERTIRIDRLRERLATVRHFAEQKRHLRRSKTELRLLLCSASSLSCPVWRALGNICGYSYQNLDYDVGGKCLFLPTAQQNDTNNALHDNPGTIVAFRFDCADAIQFKSGSASFANGRARRSKIEKRSITSGSIRRGAVPPVYQPSFLTLNIEVR